MILLFSVLFFLLVERWPWTLWLVLPLSIFFDLWEVQNFGISGLKILLAIAILFFIAQATNLFIFGKGTGENSSGRRLRI